MKKFIGHLLLTIVGLVLFLLLLVWALSPVYKQVVENNSESWIGRKVSVDRIAVNPFTGEVNIDDLHCREQNGVTDFVAFQNLYVKLRVLPLINRKVEVKHIYLTDFSAQVLRGDTAFNFSDLITRFASKDTTTEPEPSNWTIELNDIRLNNGRVGYLDVPRDKRWDVEHINLLVPGLFFGNRQSDAGLDFDMPGGGNVHLQAGYVMQTNRYSLHLVAADIQSDMILPFIQDSYNIKGLGASLNADVHVDGCLDYIQDMVVRGNLCLNGLNVLDRHKHTILAFDSLAVDIRRINLQTQDYQFSRLQLEGLTANFLKDKEGNTLTMLTKHDSDEPADTVAPVQTPSEPRPLPYIAVDRLLINTRALTYRDESMDKDFAYEIEHLHLCADNFKSQGNNNVKLTGALQHGGTLQVLYMGDMNLKQGRDGLSLSLHNVAVKDFSPFTESLMAYPLESGLLSLESNAKVENGLLHCQNKISIDTMKVGKKNLRSKAPYKAIPLALGVHLLKSASGLILLDIPVDGDISSPKFKFRKVIGRAIAKIFFGPLMGVKDNRELMSPEQREEMMQFLGNDTTTIVPVVLDSVSPIGDGTVVNDSLQME